MALTATATNLVREDVLKSLHMSNETKIVLTSFFRPNLRFTVSLLCIKILFIYPSLDKKKFIYPSHGPKEKEKEKLMLTVFCYTVIFLILCGSMQVRHSKTSSSSYGKDFHDLIQLYGNKQMSDGNKKVYIPEESHDVFSSSDATRFCEVDSRSPYDLDGDQDDLYEGDIIASHPSTSDAINGDEMSVEYLENDIDVFQSVDDWDGSYLSAIYSIMVYTSRVEIYSNFCAEGDKILLIVPPVLYIRNTYHI